MRRIRSTAGGTFFTVIVMLALRTICRSVGADTVAADPLSDAATPGAVSGLVGAAPTDCSE